MLSALPGRGKTGKELDACEAGSSVEACIDADTVSGMLSAPVLGWGAAVNELWTELTGGWAGFGVECLAEGVWPGALLLTGAELVALGSCPIGLGP